MLTIVDETVRCLKDSGVESNDVMILSHRRFGHSHFAAPERICDGRVVD